jgi:leucyl aminopeptidase
MYDTGGYSIKQSMNTMKDDMGGAATVLGVC